MTEESNDGFFYRKFVKRLLQINDTPESIALGAAVGMFIAWTPTVGIQMILMIAVGTGIRANRLAGCVMVYLSNPLTLVPIYWLDYVVGSWVLGRSQITYLQFKETLDVFTQELATVGFLEAASNFLATHSEILWPLVAGGSILGILCALPTYPMTLKLVQSHHRRKEEKNGKNTPPPSVSNSSKLRTNVEESACNEK